MLNVIDTLKSLTVDCITKSGERVYPRIAWVSERGNDHWSGYKYIKIDGKLYSEHRLIWLMHYGNLPDLEIDHINGKKQDSRIENMRLSDRGENCSNRKGWSKSGFKGVYPNQRGRPWHAKITVDKETILLGRFDTKEDAAIAYDKAALLYKGEYSKLNYPKENYL